MIPEQTEKRPIYVIGHQNPDTDAICSAIGNAEFLRTHGEPDAIAARCGEMTLRTSWVLEKAGVAGTCADSRRDAHCRDDLPTGCDQRESG